MDIATARQRFSAARRAHLATTGPDGAHIVPIVFGIHGDRIVTAVDHKPKRSTRLRRIINIEMDPRVAVMVDHYDDDWSTLWWVRADGRAVIVPADAARDDVDVLAAKYPQYDEQRPEGAVILIDVHQWRSWAATTRKAE